jgi:ABC-type branched-subunit amino acid transport system ATPase component
MLIAREIYANYVRRQVLHGVSISVAPGEIVSVVGPNGAGKSTLLKVIAGVLVPRSGRVMFGDKDVSNLAQFERARAGIGYLMQGSQVFCSLTVEENLRLAIFSHKNSRGKASFHDVLEQAPDLEQWLGRRAGLLSAGQRQLVALAMIMLDKQHKRVLLLDEPLASLSPGAAQDVLSTIRKIRENSNVSILVVEQNIGAVIEVSNRVYVIKGGVVVAEEDSNSIDARKIEEAYFG